MSTELGIGGSLPIGDQSSIEIPSSEAPEKVLKTDVVIPLPNQSSGLTPFVDTFKLKATAGDLVPNFLEYKINTDQFNITTDLLTLIGFNGLTTDDLTQGSTNLYVSQLLIDTVAANALVAHEHTNKTLLDTYAQSEANLSSAVTLKHDHNNKAILDATEESFTTTLKGQYDAATAGAISGVSAPLDLTGGVISHDNDDGNKHIPSNSGATTYDILTSGVTGVYTWENINTIISNVAIFEQSLSDSTDKGMSSNYVKDHVNNVLTNKHVTDANLTYINVTVPAHIADTSVFKHLPDIVATTDQGKFLSINASDEPVWANSGTSIQIIGETYISAIGDTITASKITLAQTELLAGDNITFATNVISSAQRAISTSSINGDNTTSISAGWAYTHENATGAGSHIPTGGTSVQYIDGTGAIANFDAAPGAIFKVIMGYGVNGTVGERLVDGATVFPTGWSGAIGVVATDLVITHDVNKEIVDVVVYSNDGVDVTKLIGSAGYSTIIGNVANTTIDIASLTTINNTIHIFIQFN